MRSYNGIRDLPVTLPIFPLTGAVLLPRGELPLNVFEPRYLAMADAVLAGDRMIGMIQPTEHEEQTLTPKLSAVGCVGRMTSFKENDDGRYMIVLTGVCRFRVMEELPVATPFRRVKPDYAPFAGDLIVDGSADFPRERLMLALRDYLTQRELNADWRSVMNAPAEALLNALAMLCPFEPAEKQALLEAVTWPDRVDTLMALLEMARVPAPAGTRPN